MEIQLSEKSPLTEPETTAKLLQRVLKAESKIDQEKEHFWTIGLNSKNIIKYLDLVSLGILNASIVHPREVFRLAIKKGIAQLIIAHNHPSGETGPSEEDLLITKRLAEAGKILGIEVVDHLIISQNGFTSLKDKGLI